MVNKMSADELLSELRETVTAYAPLSVREMFTELDKRLKGWGPAALPTEWQGSDDDE